MKRKNPRHGSMQFWPRKRAKSAVARIRSWSTDKEVKPLAFLGYKVAMAHTMANDGKQTIAVPCTIIECPPLKIYSVRFYKNNQVVSDMLNPKLDPVLKKTITLPKKQHNFDEAPEHDEIRLILYSQPSKTTIGKKKPDLFEVGLGGKDQLAWVKENIEKEIAVTDVLKEKTQIDIHSVTKGKGFQGVIKRFGVSLKHHKSEKGQRRVGARSGSWKAQAHMMYRVAQPGKMGFHLRTEYNKFIIKIGDEEITPTSGFKRYGKVQNTYVLVKGSIGGATKRAVTLTPASRPSKRIAKTKLDIEQVVA